MNTQNNTDLEDDDPPVLSGGTLAALQEFLAEQDARKDRFESLKASVEPSGGWSMDMFSEDWNASQFWYDDATATLLAEELLDGATSDTHIAVVSAPSVFVQVKNIQRNVTDHANMPCVTLLEYDSRFNVFDQFVHYDFQHPLKLDASLRGRFDRILCDPPFLSEDCQTKAAMTVRWLAKTIDTSVPKPRVIVCTGERMATTVCKLYPGLKVTSFQPQHEGGRLSNAFQCYCNYESRRWDLVV